jgi:hypothetical protein
LTPILRITPVLWHEAERGGLEDGMVYDAVRVRPLAIRLAIYDPSRGQVRRHSPDRAPLLTWSPRIR